MKILNNVYESDLLRINEIRRECTHKMNIDEKLIKSKLHNTYSYKFNKITASKLSLKGQYLYVSLRAIQNLKNIKDFFITSYLNKLLGWKGGYHNFDVKF